MIPLRAKPQNTNFNLGIHIIRNKIKAQLSFNEETFVTEIRYQAKNNQC